MPAAMASAAWPACVMNAAPPMSVESNQRGWMPRYSATSQIDICSPPSDGNDAAVANPSTSPSSRPASASAPRMHSAWIANGCTPGAFRRGDSYTPTIATSPLGNAMHSSGS